MCSCVSMLLQDILQAALHAETDMKQHPQTTSLITGSSLINSVNCKPKHAEQLVDGRGSSAVSKASDDSEQCSDRVALISATDTMKVAADRTTVFCLSRDDFNDDIDDLSFVDLAQHSELPPGLKSFSVLNVIKLLVLLPRTHVFLPVVTDVICNTSVLDLICIFF